MMTSSAATRSRSLSMFSLAAAILLALTCAPRGPATKRVERDGVAAWVVAADAIPTQGPLARAQAGDIALSDNDIIIVVSQASAGGRLIDVGRAADEGYDYLGGLVPIYDGRFEGAYTIESVDIADSPDTHLPSIVARGADIEEPRLTVSTRYEILATSHTVLVTTRIVNETTRPLACTVGDRIMWGADNVFVPGHGNIWRPSNAVTTSTWLCSWQDSFTLGITTGGGIIEAKYSRNETDLAYRTAELKPGSDLTYQRYFVVGDRQMSSVCEFASRLRGAALGWLEGEVRETGTNNPVADCRVEVLEGPATQIRAVPYQLTWLYTDETGRFRIALPVGRYFAWTRPAIGRDAPVMGISYDVSAGSMTTIKKPLQVSPMIMLNYEVRDKETGELLPSKIVFESYPGLRQVDFGPDWHGPGARNAFLSATGQGSINISLGRYRVYVSRGPEYSIYQEDIDIRPASQNQMRATLERVIRPEMIGFKEYTSMDLGVRTWASPDCRVSPRDRVTAAAAEGVECLVTGDVGVATDLTSAIEQCNLSKWVSAICGRRIQWFGAAARGEFLVFPTRPGQPKPSQMRRESNARSPSDLIRSIRAANRGSLVSACWPMDEVRGYLATHGFKTDSGELPPALTPAAMAFDLLEVLTWRTAAGPLNHQAYTRLVRDTRRYGFAAGSDSHFVRGQETGYPRLYVARSPQGGSSLFEQLRDGLSSGSVLVTNGPFIRLLVNGKYPPGSFVTDTDGMLDVLLEVHAAPWVDVRSVMLYESEFFIRQVLLPQSERLRRLPRSDADSPEYRLPLKRDMVITAMALGYTPLSPVVAQDDLRGFDERPLAITGPIFIDADGDGKCTPPDLREVYGTGNKLQEMLRK